MANEKKKELTISEVKPENSIEVTALMDNKQVDIPVTYANVTEEEVNTLTTIFGKNFIPIELIMHDVNGQSVPVSFEKQNSVLQIVVVSSNGVFKFKNVRIVKQEFKNGRVLHVIHVLTPKGIPYNRRRGVRVNIDTRMEIEQNDEKFQVLVREISYCGFSFINLSPNEFNEKQQFLLVLIERDGDKHFTVGKFIGKVHRVEKAPNGANIYGCILHEKHAAKLQKYVAMKQLEFLNGKKAFFDIQKNSNGENWRADVADALKTSLDDEQDKASE